MFFCGGKALKPLYIIYYFQERSLSSIVFSNKNNDKDKDYNFVSILINNEFCLSPPLFIRNQPLNSVFIAPFFFFFFNLLLHCGCKTRYAKMKLRITHFIYYSIFCTIYNLSNKLLKSHI